MGTGIVANPLCEENERGRFRARVGVQVRQDGVFLIYGSITGLGKAENLAIRTYGDGKD